MNTGINCSDIHTVIILFVDKHLLCLCLPFADHISPGLGGRLQFGITGSLYITGLFETPLG